jgi:hypothetical protein
MSSSLEETIQDRQNHSENKNKKRGHIRKLFLESEGTVHDEEIKGGGVKGWGDNL